MEEGSETKKALARAYTTEPRCHTRRGEKSSRFKQALFFKQTETNRSEFSAGLNLQAQSQKERHEDG